jgi:parvulin-like peptidyl-prolyl isomerase
VSQESVKIDDAEVQKYYDENKNQYVQKERIRASQILILVPPNAEPGKDAEARAKADEVLKKARSGEDFSELAKQTSEGPTAVRGGDLGYFQRGRMVPEFEEVAFSLQKAGDISNVVKTKFGYHIVKLTDKQPEKLLGLDEVKERIVRQLESKNRREIRQTLDQDLQNKAAVVITESYFQEEDPSAEEAQK